MARTTVDFKEAVYRKLVEMSLMKYGNTRNISKVANEFIEEHLGEKQFGKTIAEEKHIDESDIVEKTFGSWRIKESGAEYVKRIRKGWGKRGKRLGL